MSNHNVFLLKEAKGKFSVQGSQFLWDRHTHATTYFNTHCHPHCKCRLSRCVLENKCFTIKFFDAGNSNYLLASYALWYEIPSITTPAVNLEDDMCLIIAMGCLSCSDCYTLEVLRKDPGPRLNIKTVLSTYGDFHVKDKTAVRTSYL